MKYHVLLDENGIRFSLTPNRRQSRFLTVVGPISSESFNHSRFGHRHITHTYQFTLDQLREYKELNKPKKTNKRRSDK